MRRLRVHLIAAGAPIAARLSRLRYGDARWLWRRIARVFGERYRVSTDLRCLEASEDDRHGGRTDDARRAGDLMRALADDGVAAVIALAGGAWFSRILRRIDFDVLRRRRTPITVFGFSEMTSLVNIVSAYPMAQGIHDVAPVFVLDRARPRRTAMRQFDTFMADLRAMVDGGASARPMSGRLISGKLPRRSVIRVVGGNLTLVAAMLGTPFERTFATRGKWLALEDVNEKPERIDRMLAQLRLAGLFDRVEGLLLGDFRRDRKDLHGAVVELLRFHLPSHKIPVVGHCNFGHVWPAAPLPLNRPLCLVRQGDRLVFERCASA